LEAIVQVVERARGLPPEQCPTVAERDQDPPQVGLVVAVLMAALGDFAARERLAPNLAATTQDVKLLVRARLQGEPAPSESLLTRGWRSVPVRPHLEAVLDGRRSLRVRDVRAEAPFAYADAE